MYKYSKRSQEIFFNEPVYAFLFACFGFFDAGQAFITEKCADKGAFYQEMIRRSVETLCTEAYERLTYLSQKKQRKLTSGLLMYLQIWMN
jgi:hypothetical protein